jgi:GTP 3',8-cyclase
LRLFELADDIHAAGVERLNVSLDALDPARYARMTRRDGAKQVLAGLDRALAVGFAKVKVNAVIVPGVNEEEVVGLAGLAERRPIDVRFIEQMPLDGAADRRFLGAAEIIKRIGAVYPLVPVAPEDPRQAAQQMFRSPSLEGLIGLVAARSGKFCHACNRLRLTPLGELKGCLLAAGTLDVRGPLRASVTDAALDELLARAIGVKPREHADESYDVGGNMRSVGG